MDIYDRIDAILKEKGLKPVDIHKATGISTSLLTQWKQRKQSPSVEKLMLVANYFGVPVDYLLTGEKSQKNPPAEAGGNKDIEAINKMLNSSPPEVIARARRILEAAIQIDDETKE